MILFLSKKSMKKILSSIVLLSLLFGQIWLIQAEEKYELCYSWYEYITDLMYSPDGEKILFSTRTNGTYNFSENWKNIAQWYAGWVSSGLHYSQDGNKKLLTVVKNVATSWWNYSRKYILVDDEKEIILGDEYGFISSAQYSPSGNDTMFIVQRWTKSVLVNEPFEVSGDYDSVWDFVYSWETDDSLEYIAKKWDSWYLVKKDNKIKLDWDYDSVLSFQYSPDKENFTFVWYNKATYDWSSWSTLPSWTLVRNGNKVKTYWSNQLEYMYLSDNSFVHRAQNWDQWGYLKDGTDINIWDNFDFVWWLKFSPNAKDFTFMARKWGKYMVMKGDQQLGSYEYNQSTGTQYEWYGQILWYTYSPDGKNFAFIGRMSNDNYWIYALNCPTEKTEDDLETQDGTNIDKIQQYKTKAQLSKQSIVVKGNLNKSSKTRKYIEQVELIASKLSLKKAEKLASKLQSMPAASRNNSKYKDIFDYLEAKIMLRLLDWYDIVEATVDVDNEEETLTSTDSEKFGFTSPSVNGIFSTKSDEITIRWFTTLEWISRVQINANIGNSELKSFNGTTWRYHAFTRFNNLVEWVNEYVVIYYWRDDEVVYTDYFNIIKNK